MPLPAMDLIKCYWLLEYWWLVCPGWMQISVHGMFYINTEQKTYFHVRIWYFIRKYKEDTTHWLMKNLIILVQDWNICQGITGKTIPASCHFSLVSKNCNKITEILSELELWVAWQHARLSKYKITTMYLSMWLFSTLH